MPKIAYRSNALRSASADVVRTANTIIAEYAREGMKLTLRQLYYQFVSRALLENTVKNYKRLGDIVTNGRYAGMIDWNAIEDRTRNLRGGSGGDTSPTAAIESMAEGYSINKWENQPYAVELWVEKEALAGVIERTASALEVTYMACKGYMSASEMWGAAMRFGWYVEHGRKPYIIHLGDHDPSGIDMSRDIEDRTREFLQVHGLDDFEFKRIALNMDQVRQYNPPPNPAKDTDSRCADYKLNYGDESWELDALEPRVLDQLMRDAILAVRDETLWDEAQAKEDRERTQLMWVKDKWDDISAQAEADIEDGTYSLDGGFDYDR